MGKRAKLALLFDHTNLKSYACPKDIDLLCIEAEDNGFASVCVHGYWVGYIAESFPNVRICQVLNFPLGLTTGNGETLAQINTSAHEYDLVMNISKFKEGKYEEVRDSIHTVKNFVGKKILKVIVESGVLDNNELVVATDMVAQSGADFIKTSTGFITQPEHELIRQVDIIHNVIKLHQLNLQIKASGGIKSLDLVKVLIGIGVTRFGSSQSHTIIRELRD